MLPGLFSIKDQTTFLKQMRKWVPDNGRSCIIYAVLRPKVPLKFRVPAYITVAIFHGHFNLFNYACYHFWQYQKLNTSTKVRCFSCSLLCIISRPKYILWYKLLFMYMYWKKRHSTIAGLKTDDLFRKTTVRVTTATYCLEASRWNTKHILWKLCDIIIVANQHYILKWL